jgi:hypothetical protein|mmetsp:Transcript_9917/g.25540  ORF Transcript_9917/g.25540 Transcript_9917/m.25540 type:complete len:113 (-) Transcript_9917:1729-2067(-)
MANPHIDAHHRLVIAHVAPTPPCHPTEPSSYAVVVSDLEHFADRVHVGGLLVVDDAGNDLEIKGRGDSNSGFGDYKGWPDVSRAVLDVLGPDPRFEHVLAYQCMRVWRRVRQ